MPLRDGARVSDADGAEWLLAVDSQPIATEPDAQDYKLTWTLASGSATSVAVGVVFEFKDWAAENFVFVPAAVYDGNRFDVKHIGYPPYWYDTKEWRLDMPTTMSERCPTLGKDGGAGCINLDTGNASVPMIAFQSPAKQTGWMVQTTQGSRLGNHGLILEENAGRSTARFTITAPAVRNDYHPANWKAGDSVTIQFRTYAFPAKQRADLLRRFSEVRKDLNPAVRAEALPFSAAWKLLEELYRTRRWDERIGMFWLSDVGEASKGWNFIWQLGWCGGGQVTLPLLMQGDEQSRQHARRNLDVIFGKSQAASGFFNAYGNGKEFASFGFGSKLKHNECLVRSQGDWLYMAQRQFQQIESAGDRVPDAWQESLHHLADAFTRLWDKRGQFGQFVDVETGDLCIGQSTSGGIVPGALALASQTFKNPRYLEIAEAAARKYYSDYVQKGYTTGGPGEILSAPDSESAFGLFESFMALHEVTGQTEWLRYAGELLPICASWTVSYDYQFPKASPMGSIDARSCGAVWASIANKHGAPGICTWSGDSLLKYYRATSDRRALELITDIAHGITQYISRPDRPIGKMPPGGLCERVNLSDWEGLRNVGGNIFSSCSWVETAGMLTVAQMPGLYVQPDTGVFAAFDNVRVEKISQAGEALKLRITNPTKFPAEVKCLVETSGAARKPVATLMPQSPQIIALAPGASTEKEFAVKGL